MSTSHVGQPAPLRSPGGGTSEGAGVERCVLLYEPRGLLGQSVALLVKARLHYA